MSAVGLYTLTSYTSLPADLNHLNDTLSKTLLIDVPKFLQFLILRILIQMMVIG